MAPKRNPTQTATVHNTDIDTSAGHANNQTVTRRDLDMLARNLTAAFSEQLRAVVNNNNPAQQRVLEDMANQIKNLQERIQPHIEMPKSHESQDGNSRMSRSSRRNKKRRENQGPMQALIEVTPEMENLKPPLEMPILTWKARSRGHPKVSNHW